MTTLREAAQQALEALDNYRIEYDYHGNPIDEENANLLKSIAALRAVLAQQEEPETCTWHQDGDSDSGTYSTSCRHYFNLEDGTPADNKMQWCCYCGKKLIQELITENSDD